MAFSYSSCGPTSSSDQNHPLNVVITGGCGFLGRHIARSLYNEFKYVRINLVDISPADTRLMKFITDGVPLGMPIGFSVADRDVTRLPHLIRIFKDADIVFHCAARTDTKASFTKMSLVNIDGTRNVIRACKECGVRALVYSGSLVQNLKASVTTQHGISESSWENTSSKFIAPSVAYTKSKAEQLILEAADDTLFTCSIRCPPLYGEFDTLLVPPAISLTKLCYGFFPNCGDPNIRMTAMYAGNAGWAHVCAAKKLLDPTTRQSITGKFFYVGDRTPSESYSKFFMKFLGPLGYSQSSIRIPMIILEVLLYIMSLIVVMLSFIFNLNSSYYLVEYQRRLKLFSVSHTVVWGRARLSLGYKPKYTFYKALRSSLNDWYSYLN